MMPHFARCGIIAQGDISLAAVRGRALSLPTGEPCLSGATVPWAKHPRFARPRLVAQGPSSSRWMTGSCTYRPYRRPFSPFPRNRDGFRVECCLHSKD